MLSIYTTEDIINTIVQDDSDKYLAWFDFISKTKPTMIVSLNVESDYEVNDAHPLFCLEQNYDIEVVLDNEEDDVISKILSSENFELTNGNSIFILDVDEGTAQNISNKYGVICHSFCIPAKENQLFQEGIEKNVDKNEYNLGWQNVICSTPVTPTNALIFVDRYLFSSDSKGQITAEDGINNVYEILDQTLPKKLCMDFHVLLVFDATKSESQIQFDKICTRINKLKTKLKRPYNILIELLSINSSNFNYSETHNRRILSNYYLIKVDHSLKAFRNGNCLYSQSISLDYAASKGIVRQKASDVPIKSINKYIRELKVAIEYMIEKRIPVQFAQNGNSHIPINNILNRLIGITTF